MRYGLVLPSMEARELAELAAEAEASGWDGVFVWDVIVGQDPWVSLAAAAMATERVRLGTMLTPPSRRRPYKLANETATLDHLSCGRVILPLGLGAVDLPVEESGFYKLGEEIERRVRARMLDEAIDVLTGLWSGEPFTYEGEHYRVLDVTGYPSLQRPRIPIWVVGAWPRERSMRRVLRCDGLLPAKKNPDGTGGKVTPEDLREMKAYVEEHRNLASPFDIVMEGRTPGDNPERAADVVRQWAEAGATWWLESLWDLPGGLEEGRARIRRGAPCID